MRPRAATISPSGARARAAQVMRAAVPVLETERLRLRAPDLADLPLWTAPFQGPEAEFLGGPFADAEGTAWEEFAYYTGCWMLYGHGLWTIERLQDGAAIGFVHLAVEWDDPEPELGWHLIPDARGHGYAEEAARAARDYGLGLLDSFVSYIDPANAPSNRVAERLGATRDLASEAHIATYETAPTHVWRHGGTA